MKRIMRVALLFAAMALWFPVPVWADPKAYTMEEFLASADSVLNGNYQRILRLYADDPAFVERIKTSQRAWLRFRDAEMAALFPHANMDLARWQGLTPAQQHWLTILTQERSMQLVRWIKGAQPDDPPSSIKRQPVQ